MAPASTRTTLYRSLQFGQSKRDAGKLSHHQGYCSYDRIRLKIDLVANWEMPWPIRTKG